MADSKGSAQTHSSQSTASGIEGVLDRLGLLLGRLVNPVAGELNPEIRPLFLATQFIFFKQPDWLQDLFKKPEYAGNSAPLSDEREAILVKSIMTFKDQLKAHLAQQHITGPQTTQAPKLKDSQIKEHFSVVKASQPNNTATSTPPTSNVSSAKRQLDPASAGSQVGEHAAKRQRTSTGTAADKPQNMTFKIREMSLTGLGVKHVECEASADIALAFDRYRAYCTFPKDTEVLKQVSDPYELKTAIDKLNGLHGGAFDTRTIFQEAAKPNPRSRPTLSAELTFNNDFKNHNFFRFKPCPIKYDQPNRVQLRYGWKRVLYLDVDLHETLPQHMKAEKPAIIESFKKWLMREHHLFSWKWRAFHLQRSNEGRVRNGKFQWRVVLFAVHDRLHYPTSLEEFVLKWMIPAQFNSHQPACKAYSRIDLALSRIYRGLVFEPEQIILVDDLLPTSTTYQDQFLDPDYACEHREIRQYDNTEAMTDGCAMISVGAAKLINKKLGIKSLPTAYQARIAGSKGMWHISAGYDTTDAHHLGVWIQIRKSQVKVRHHTGPHARVFSEGLDPLFAKDKGLLSFNVVRYTKVPGSATIHKDFLPVLEDRGVLRTDIMALAKASLREETEEMHKGIADPVLYARQVQRYLPPASVAVTQDGMLSRDAAARLWTLLHDGGFMPSSIRFVADEYLRMCAQAKLRVLTSVHIRCEESCVLLGIADPYGVLQEGEVHIKLTGFQTGGSSNKYAVPNGKNVLIARDPTVRASDIQKFKAVDNAKLSHLVNVVVFSSKGSMPAAARLQGGDYDGDTFTVIWYPPFVNNFQNAPVLQCKSPGELGIEVDATLLSSFLPELQPGEEDLDIQPCHVNKFLRHVFAFKLNDNCLGAVTNHLYAWINKHEDLSSAQALDLIDLHDLLVDQAKNGYSFSEGDWKDFVKQGKLTGCDTPGYQKAIKELDTRLKTAYSEKLEEDKKDLVPMLINYEPRSKPQNGTSHVVDDLFFNIMMKSIKKSLGQLRSDLASVNERDPDLSFALTEYKEQNQDARGTFDTVARETVSAIGKVMKNWPAHKGSFNKAAVDQMLVDYRAIKMLGETSALHFRPAKHAFTIWERLRAGILLLNFAIYKQKAVFWLASDVFCAMKRDSESGRAVLKALLPQLKVKKPQLAMAQYLELDIEEDDMLKLVDDQGFELDDSSIQEMMQLA